MHSIMRLIASVLLVCFTAGCVSTKPERFATVQEAFPINEPLSTNGLSHDSFRSAVYEAPFDDVFRAATTAITFADFNIESSDSANGIILASNENTYRSRNSFGGDFNRRHSFAVVLTKKGRTSTEVTIYSKIQSTCRYMGLISSVLFIVVSAGVGVLYTPVLILDYSTCSELAELHWVTESQESKAPKMAEILTSIRQKLMTSGAL